MVDLPPDQKAAYAKWQEQIRVHLGDKEYQYRKMLSEALAITHTDSDRSAGIVFGSMVEEQLVRALRRHFKNDGDAGLIKAENEMLNLSGALGAFATRIHLGALIGIYGASAWRALDLIKDVRNRFAHRPDAYCFDHNQVTGLLDQLRFVENMLVEKADGQLYLEWTGGGTHFARAYSKSDNPFSTRRGRYEATCVFFVDALATATPVEPINVLVGP